MAAHKQQTIGSGAEAILDEQIVGALREIMGPATEVVVAKACAVIEARTADIEDADPEARARLAHEIGGVSGQIGLKRLAHEALMLEHALREDPACDVSDRVAALKRTARASLEAVAP